MGLLNWMSRGLKRHRGRLCTSQQFQIPDFEILEPRVLLSGDAAFMPDYQPLDDCSEPAIYVNLVPESGELARPLAYSSEGNEGGEKGPDVGIDDQVQITTKQDNSGLLQSQLAGRVDRHQEQTAEHYEFDTEESESTTRPVEDASIIAPQVFESIKPRGPPNDSEGYLTTYNPNVYDASGGFHRTSNIGFSAHSNTQEVVFIDADVAEIYDIFNSDLNEDIEVFVLDSAQNGVVQITDILADYKDISAVHIISHGASGQVSLGLDLLDSASLPIYADDLAVWGNALTEDGDILFYGCAVAQGNAGLGLINLIAELTGADVAASIDATGTAELGGNWALEAQTGPIETSLVLDAETINEIGLLLDVYLNEVVVDLDGASDNPNEYIELRGTANQSLANTHLIFLQGDSEFGLGEIQSASFTSTVDLGAYSLGSNGFLVVVDATSAPYTIEAGTTVVDVPGLDVENASYTAFLVEVDNTGTAPVVGQDLDSGDDGLDALPTGWTILDGVSVLDGGSIDRGYAQTVFSSDANGFTEAGATFVNTGFGADDINQVMRVGDSVGTTASDWVAFEHDDTGTVIPPDFVIEQSTDPQYTSGTIITNHLGQSNSGEAPVVFGDANLKTAVESALGIPNPTPTEMLGLISFSSVYGEIADLTGLEHATNLTVLELYWNEITDITPLSGLTNLTFLNLQHNQINDTTQLSGLTNMDYLDLADNQVADIGSLSGFSSLTHLRLGSNQVTDVGPLSGLTTLTELHISGNQINDVGLLSSLVNLQSLDLGGNRIGNMDPLTGLTNLQWLSLWGSQISVVPDLSALAVLTNLSLGHNQISNISGLSEVTTLTSLSLDNNQISDIGALEDLTALEYLDLRYNHIIDISWLSGITDLRELQLHDNEIVSLAAIGAMDNLEHLSLENNQISDISALSGMTAFRELRLSNNQISVISALAGMTALTNLSIARNQISNIGTLSSLPNLQSLDLGGNQILDFTPLAGLTGLQWLSLWDNQISVVPDLSALAALTELHLGSNLISSTAPLAALTGLTRLDLNNNPLGSITDLSNLTSLTRLSLSSTGLSSIGVVADLTNLTELDLNDNSLGSSADLS